MSPDRRRFLRLRVWRAMYWHRWASARRTLNRSYFLEASALN